MIEATKLFPVEQQNQAAKPVEPVRKPLASSEDRQQQPDSGKVAQEARLAGQKVTKEQAETTMRSMNDFMSSINTAVRFSVHEGTDQMVVKVIDEKTGETIRQIPSEELLEMAAHMKEMAEYMDRPDEKMLGVLLDHKQ